MFFGGGLTIEDIPMKISENLNQIIMAAYAEANTRSHEFVTPEHLLYAALFFDEGAEIIQRCGGDPEHLKRVLSKQKTSQLTPEN